MGLFPVSKRSSMYSNQAKYVRGINRKVTHSKDQTESQIQSTENGNTECPDKVLEWTK